jgi:hypothetical protein
VLPAVETEAPKVTGFYGPNRQARDPLRLADIPAILRDAVVAVEDKRFFEHRGLDPRSILRALWADLRALEAVQGGSTITQQLAKNLFLSHRKTIVRKVAEAVYAKRFESLYPKDAILEAYLNEVYLGADRGVQIEGVAEGSRHYFGLDVRDINLPRAAMLAGLRPGTPVSVHDVYHRARAGRTASRPDRDHTRVPGSSAPRRRAGRREFHPRSGLRAVAIRSLELCGDARRQVSAGDRSFHRSAPVGNPRMGRNALPLYRRLYGRPVGSAPCL